MDLMLLKCFSALWSLCTDSRCVATEGLLMIVYALALLIRHA